MATLLGVSVYAGIHVHNRVRPYHLIFLEPLICFGKPVPTVASVSCGIQCGLLLFLPVQRKAQRVILSWMLFFSPWS